MTFIKIPEFQGLWLCWPGSRLHADLFFFLIRFLIVEREMVLVNKMKHNLNFQYNNVNVHPLSLKSVFYQKSRAWTRQRLLFGVEFLQIPKSAHMNDLLFWWSINDVWKWKLFYMQIRLVRWFGAMVNWTVWVTRTSPLRKRHCRCLCVEACCWSVFLPGRNLVGAIFGLVLAFLSVQMWYLCTCSCFNKWRFRYFAWIDYSQEMINGPDSNFIFYDTCVQFN